MERNNPWPSENIRHSFLEYFIQRDALLLSQIDPEVNGIQFGSTVDCLNRAVAAALAKHPELGSAVAIHKRIRISGDGNELRYIGNDTCHHSYFEMLSAYSFGPDSQQQAIEHIWKLLTEVFGMSEDRISVTISIHRSHSVPTDVNTVEKIWGQYLSKDRILREERYDPYSQMVGMNIRSKVYYDRVGDRSVSGLDFKEQIRVGALIHIGTIMSCWHNNTTESIVKYTAASFGLERLAAILQKKSSNYDTDLFDKLLQKIQDITKAGAYGGKFSKEDLGYKDKAYRIIADHIRAIVFAISSGLITGPTGKGYVLRKLIRRTYYYGLNKLKAPDLFLADLANALIDQLDDSFVDLKTNRKDIIDQISIEEKTFQRCYSKGIARFKQIVQDLNPGDEVPVHGTVLLYNTYGFDIELQSIIAEESRLHVDIRKFMQNINNNTPVIPRSDNELYLPLFTEDITILLEREIPRTDNSCRYRLDETAHVLAIWTSRFLPDKFDCQNKRCGIILDRSNFEIGPDGQVYDIGTISNESFKFMIEEVHSYNGYLLHVGRLAMGQINIGDTVHLHADGNNRMPMKVHQTSSHLLNLAMRKVLDKQNEELNSQCTPKRVRLDYPHIKSLTIQQVNQIEQYVNGMITRDLPIYAETIPVHIAQTISGIRVSGVIKNGMTRVVSIGVTINEILESPTDPKWQDFSVVICDDAHVTNTGQLQHFVIMDECVVAAGERRIIGVAGHDACSMVSTAEELEKRCEGLEKMIRDKLLAQLKQPLIDFLKEFESASISYSKKAAIRQRTTVLQRLVESCYIDNIEEQKLRGQRLVNDVQKRLVENPSQEFFIVVEKMENCIQEVIYNVAKAIATELKPDNKPKAAMIFSVDTTKQSVLLCSVVNQSFIDKQLLANKWAAAVAPIIGGKSGGKAGMAQGRGTLLELAEAMKVATEYARKIVINCK